MNEHDGDDEQIEPDEQHEHDDAEAHHQPEEPAARYERGETLNRNDEPVEVEVRDPMDRVVPLRLSPARFDALTNEARELGLSPAALARMWVIERLREVQSGGSTRQRQPAPERDAPPPGRRAFPRDFEDERPPRPRYEDAPPGRPRFGDGPPARRPPRDFDDAGPPRRPARFDDEGPPRRPRGFDDAGPPRSAPRPYQGGGPPRRPGPPRGGPPAGGGFDRRAPRRPGPPPGGRPGPRRPRRDE